MAIGLGGAATVAAGRVVLRADNKELSQDLRKAETDFKNTGSKLGTAAKAAGVAMAAGLGLAVVGLKKSVDAAVEAEQSQRRMQTQLKALGISYKDHAKQIDQVIDKHSKLSAFDDEDLTESFTKFVRVTGNVNEALKANAIAADFARGRNIDLATASKVIEKVLNGNVSVLSRYGIQLEEGATKQDALAAIQQKFAGQAEAYGNSTAGAQDKIGVAIENLQEKVGSKLLPALAGLATAFVDVVIPAAQRAAEWIGDKLAPVFGAVKDAVSGVIDFIRDNWDKIVDFIRPPLERAAELFKTIWDGIRAVLSAAWEGIQKVIGDHADELKKIWDALQSAAEVMVDGIKWVLKNVLQPVAEFVFGTLLPRTIGLAIDALSALVDAGRWMRDNVVAAFNFVRDGVIDAINFVLEGVDKFLGGIQAMLEAAGHLPFVGDKFDGLAEKVGGARKGVQGLQEDMKNLKSKEVKVTVAYNFTADPNWVGGINMYGGDGADGFDPVPTHRAILNASGKYAVRFGLKSLGSSGGTPRPDVIQSMWDEVGMANTLGLNIISTYRPGATTAGGSPSAHSYYPSRAIDVASGSRAGQDDPRMRAYFNAMIGRPGLDEVILSPLIWTKSGGLRGISSGKVKADHWDHVHVADYPGWDGLGPGGDGFGPVAAPAGGWGATPKGRVLSWVEVAKTVYNAGVRNATKAIRLIAEVGGESSRHSGALGDGGQSRGLWQIYRPAWPGVSDAQAFNPNTAAGAASSIYDRQGPGAWHGNEQPYMSSATSAWNQVKSGPSSSGGGSGGSASSSGGGGSSGSVTVPASSPPASGSAAALLGWPSESEWVAMKAISQKASAQRTASEKALFAKYADFRAANPGWHTWTVQEYRQKKQAALNALPPPAGPPTGPTFPEEPPGGPSEPGFPSGPGTPTGPGGPTQEEIEAQIQERLQREGAAIFGARQRYFNEFAPNVFTPGPQGLTAGSTAPLQNVQIVQQFNRPVEDQFTLLRHAIFAAQSVIGA